jgi:4-hydroxymandelate oxidase
LCLDDFEVIARERLDAGAYAYYTTGAADEVTLEENVSAWARWHFVPRVLRDTRRVDLATVLLGSAVTAPVGIAPVALQGLAHPDGELATARAAATAGILFILSTASTRTIEEVAAAIPAGTTGPRWFQLYVEHDMGYARELVQRAEAAGYAAIVLTVDLPVIGSRERDRRAGFNVPATIQAHLPPLVAGEFRDYIDMKSVVLTWDDVATIASWTRLPVVLKGILNDEDARLAVLSGARAIIVSNHGGRQLDHSVTAPEVLRRIVDAVDGALEIYADGGVRRGTDIAVGVALGARALFIGRPMVYALATAGQAGVSHALEIVLEELRRASILLGVRRLGELGSSSIRNTDAGSC